mmetsp:Transcript_15446/g.27963  ORF Transcript_15446/g.27963 Transcript_15446/m.27963 type:complete len:159 (-) Transcript_15446:3107-3583(-)
MHLQDRLDLVANAYFSHNAPFTEDALAYWQQRQLDLNLKLAEERRRRDGLKDDLSEARAELKYIKRERDDLLKHSAEDKARTLSCCSAGLPLQDSNCFPKVELEIFKVKADLAGAKAELEGLEEKIELVQLELNKSLARRQSRQGKGDKSKTQRSSNR